MMITVFKEDDKTVWIPVAKGKNGGPSRAFLPFNGENGQYTFGYKATPSRANYFDALKEVQRTFIGDDTKTFLVNEGKKK